MIKIFRFISVQFTFFLMLGIVFGYFLNPNIQIIAITLVLCFLVLFVVNYWTSKSIKPTIYFNTLTYFTVFVLGILVMILKTDANSTNHYSKYLVDEDTAVLKIDEILKSDAYYDKYFVKVKQLNNKKVSGKILLNVAKDSIIKNLNVDDELYLKTKFNEVSIALNPYYFNYKEYLKKQNVQHQIRVKSTDFLSISNPSRTLKGYAHLIRIKINEALLKYHFKEETLAIMNAILLGQRQELSKEIQENYAGAGAIHILAISGLHIGIILLILNFLFKPIEGIKYGKPIKALLILVFLWSFGIVAGLSASVVRAVTMFTVVTIGMHLKRPANIFNTLFLSMFVLLLFNPFYLFDVGFQLSYLAVFSIVIFQPKIYKIWNPKYIAVDYFWKLFTVSIAAQIGVLPISFYYFHQFPSLFFLSNLVIIPFLGVILFAGILIIILALSNMLPVIFTKIYDGLIYSMNHFVNWIATQELFLIKNISFSMYKMLATYLVIVTFIYFLSNNHFKRLKYVLLGVLVFQSILFYEKYHLETSSELIVFHKNKNTIIGDRNGKKVVFYHDLDSINFNKNKIIQSYLVGTGIHNYQQKPLQNILTYQDKNMLIIDSLGVYNLTNLNPNIIVLTHSPKINLQRLIDSIKPKMILADGSNYKSYIKLWEQTCVQNKTPFYATTQKGVFIYK